LSKTFGIKHSSMSVVRIHFVHGRLMLQKPHNHRCLPMKVR